MQRIRLSVLYEESRASYEFTADQQIQDVVERAIQGHSPRARTQGLGVIQKPAEGCPRWLKLDKTIAAYDLSNYHGELVVRRTRLPLKIRLADGTASTILADFSVPVSDVIRNLCYKLTLADEEYCGLRIDRRWLVGSKSLTELRIEPGTVADFRKMLVFSDAKIDRNNYVDMHHVYSEDRDAIVSGEQPCIFEEAMEFAALVMQIWHGNFNLWPHTKGWLTEPHLNNVVALPFRNFPGIEAEIESRWQHLSGMSKLVAMYRFHTLSRDHITYGISRYHCMRREPQAQTTTILGVCERGVFRFEPTTNVILEHRRFGDLIRWAYTDKEVLLDWTGKGIDRYITSEGSSITALIAGHIDVILKRMAKEEADAAAQETKAKIP